MPDQITILAVDDQPQNLRLLDAVLAHAATGWLPRAPESRRWRS